MPTPTKPHLRMTMSGEIAGGAEIFSMNLALGKRANGFWALFDEGMPQEDFLTGWRDSATAFFANPDTGIREHAVLKRVKFALIGDDGAYLDAPQEYAVNVPGGHPQGAAHPWQISHRVTLGTDGDLDRVKGGFYLPCPVWGIDPLTDRIALAAAEAVRTRVVTFIDALANQQGPDIQDWRVVVASGGRHNSNGTVRLPPDLYDVQRVKVGRRLDVQRRRANDVDELASAWAPVNQV